MMMATSYPKHAKALARAEKDLAARVKEKPLGSNTNGRVREMQGRTWLGGTGWPWCAAAVVTWAEEAGFVLPYQGAGAWAWLDWARKAGWSVSLGVAIPGDFVVWNIGSGHISMLAKPYSLGSGVVETIDGNSSDRVKRSGRPASLVRGVVHLPELAHKIPPVKPPIFEVIGSESGHRMVVFRGPRSAVGKWIAKTPIGQRFPKGVTIRRRKP